MPATSPDSANNTVAPAAAMGLVNAIGAYFSPPPQGKTDTAATTESNPQPTPTDEKTDNRASGSTVPADTDKSPGQWAFRYDPKSQQISMDVKVAAKLQGDPPTVVLMEYQSIVDPNGIPSLINWFNMVKSAIEKTNPNKRKT